MKAIAGLLMECEESLYEQDGDETMMLHLNRLYEVIPRLKTARPTTRDQCLRFMLGLMAKKARTLRRAIEEQLGVRN